MDRRLSPPSQPPVPAAVRAELTWRLPRDDPGLARVRGLAGAQLVLGHHAEVVLVAREDAHQGEAAGVQALGRGAPGHVRGGARQHRVVQRGGPPVGLVRGRHPLDDH